MKGSNMVSISKKWIIKGKNAEQKRSWTQRFYDDNVDSKEDLKSLTLINTYRREIKISEQTAH
jgi:hypothetical protein